MINFTEHIHNWAKAEVLQGKIMIVVGVLFLIALLSILKSQHQLLRGASIPFSIIVTILIGYGSYVIHSRTMHIKERLALFQKSQQEAIVKEKNKHAKEYKMGKIFMKTYPILVIITMVALLFLNSTYYQGWCIGMAILSIIAFIVDYGFVSRSSTFLSFLNT